MLAARPARPPASAPANSNIMPVMETPRISAISSQTPRRRPLFFIAMRKHQSVRCLNPRDGMESRGGRRGGDAGVCAERGETTSGWTLACPPWRATSSRSRSAWDFGRRRPSSHGSRSIRDSMCSGVLPASRASSAASSWRRAPSREVMMMRYRSSSKVASAVRSMRQALRG